jgi:hypothetical protein
MLRGLRVEELRSLRVKNFRIVTPYLFQLAFFLFYNTSPCHFHDYLKGTIISGNV